MTENPGRPRHHEDDRADAADDGVDAIERLVAERPAPGPEVASALAELEAARAAAARSLDELTSATQSALDIPAKIRRNPVKTAALAGGAGFLMLGGPRRVVRFVARQVRSERDPHEGLLPDEIEAVLRDTGVANDPAVRRALDEDFAEYLKRKGRSQPEPGPARSFWRTFDTVAGPLGTVAARLLVQRLMEAERERAAERAAARQHRSARRDRRR